MAAAISDKNPTSAKKPDADDVAGDDGRPTTMSDIARLAGVSAMTVSRALKADGSVSSATRKKILNVIANTGYVPDSTARIFATKRSGFVAALIPSINNSNFAETARGIMEALEGSGLQLLLGSTDYAADRECELVAAMLQRRPEAMILTGGAHTGRTRSLIKAARIPIVETWDLPKLPLGHVVGFSNALAASAMAKYLASRGYCRLGFIGGTSERDTRGSERRIGFTAAAVALGLPEVRTISFGKPPISMEQGGQAMSLMLERWPEVEAVMCVSDLSAFGALMECQRRGIKVPEKMAVAGFGDFEVARCCYPAITTLAVDCHAIGKCAGDILVQALSLGKNRETLPEQTIMIDYRVIARDTA